MEGNKVIATNILTNILSAFSPIQASAAELSEENAGEVGSDKNENSNQENNDQSTNSQTTNDQSTNSNEVGTTRIEKEIVTEEIKEKTSVPVVWSVDEENSSKDKFENIRGKDFYK